MEAIEDVGFDVSVLTVRPLLDNSRAKNVTSFEVVGGQESSEINNGNGAKSYSKFSNDASSNAQIMETTFALEGLTCAVCVNAVKQAVISLGPGAGLDVDSVDVRLLPDATLTAKYDKSKMNEDDIVDEIEAVGFGATLSSKREVQSLEDAMKGMADGGGRMQRTTKMLYISLVKNQNMAFEYLQSCDS